MEALRRRGLIPDLADLDPRLVAAPLAAAGAAVFTLSAYVASPFALPAMLLALGFAVVALYRPAWGVAGALLAVPLELLSVPLPGAGAVSPAESGLLLVGVAWIARALLRGESVARPALRDLPVIALLGVIAVGLARADDPAPVFRVLTLWTLFYCVYLQAQTFTPREMRGVLAALLVGAGALGALGAVGYLGSGHTGVLAGGTVTQERAVGTFTDANYFASLLVLALLPGIALAIGDVRRNAWLLPGVVAAFAGLLFSLSRGAMAAFAIGLLVLLAWGRARWIALALVALWVPLTVAGANPVVRSDQFGVVQERLTTLGGSLSTTSKRPEIWDTAIGIATDNPFFGIGANQFKAEAARRGLFERGAAIENAHSVPLSLAAETGVIGLAGFLAFVLQLAARAATAMRARDRLRYPLGLGLSAALLAFLLQGLTIAQIRTPIVAGAFFVFAGMLTGLADRARGETPAAAAARAQPAHPSR